MLGELRKILEFSSAAPLPTVGWLCNVLIPCIVLLWLPSFLYLDKK